MSSGINLSCGGNNFSYIFSGDKWNIQYVKHDDDKTMVVVGTNTDLNRCISSTPVLYQDLYDMDAFVKLRRAYIDGIRAFLQHRYITLNGMHDITIPSLVNVPDYYVRDSYGHLMVSLSHRTGNIMSLRNFVDAAEKIFEIEIGEFVSQQERSLDDIIKFMDTASVHISFCIRTLTSL